MKAKYLNPVISSLSNVLEMVLQIKPQKGSLSKLEVLETSKDYTVIIDIEGDIKGYFTFGFSEDTAFKMVKAMTGMEVSGELDELGKSCITEIGGMARGNIINALIELGYKCEVGEGKLFKKDELPTYQPTLGLKFVFETEMDDIEMNISLKN